MSEKAEKLNALYIELMRDVAAASYGSKEFAHMIRCILFIWNLERQRREAVSRE